MRILLLDIETAPNLVHVWGLWQQNVSISQIMDASYVMCWAAKWHGEKEMAFHSLHKSTSRKMLLPIHKLLDEADAVVHYNGSRFDIPTLNKEFVLHGMKPPSPYRQIDLLQTAREKFRFPSNKLDYVAKALKLGSKTKNKGHELWVRCMAGEVVAWQDMEEYNRNDVALLEKVYNVLRPWVKSHPNMGTYTGIGRTCPHCGSTKVQARGYQHNPVNSYKRLQCMGCGAWSREALSITSIKERRELLRPIP